MDTSFRPTMIDAIRKARELAHDCIACTDADGARFWIAMQHRLEADLEKHREVFRDRTHREAELVSAE